MPRLILTKVIDGPHGNPKPPKKRSGKAQPKTLTKRIINRIIDAK